MADARAETVTVPPEELIARAPPLFRAGTSVSPSLQRALVGYEYVRDCARLAHGAKLQTVLVTNGTVCRGRSWRSCRTSTR
jgi:pyruvate formate lyase activating enzyme